MGRCNVHLMQEARRGICFSLETSFQVKVLRLVIRVDGVALADIPNCPTQLKITPN
jgi:hypothetical protein